MENENIKIKLYEYVVSYNFCKKNKKKDQVFFEKIKVMAVSDYMAIFEVERKKSKKMISNIQIESKHFLKQI